MPPGAAGLVPAVGGWAGLMGAAGGGGENAGCGTVAGDGGAGDAATGGSPAAGGRGADGGGADGGIAAITTGAGLPPPRSGAGLISATEGVPSTLGSNRAIVCGALGGALPRLVELARAASPASARLFGAADCGGNGPSGCSEGSMRGEGSGEGLNPPLAG